MIKLHKDFFIKIYEECLTTTQNPYTILGKRLANGLNLFAVSIWTTHAKIARVNSRIVFYQHDETKDISEKDQELAEEVLTTKKGAVGHYNGHHYWTAPLIGAYAHSAIVIWLSQPFSEENSSDLKDIQSRLKVLIDFLSITDPSEYTRLGRELKRTQFMTQRRRPALGALGGKEYLSYRVLPAYELGGDYLDIITDSSGNVGLTVADAMGKGVPGAFIMLIARTIFRFITTGQLDPGKVLSLLNRQFVQELENLDTFVTQFYGVYNPTTRIFTYGNAGHNPPILYRKSRGETDLLLGKGMALGIKGGIDYESYTIQLEPGDILIIYSDGLSDHRNSQNKSFGVYRIMETIEKYKEYSADGICTGILNTVLTYSAEQTDDLSFMILKAE